MLDVFACVKDHRRADKKRRGWEKRIDAWLTTSSTVSMRLWLCLLWGLPSLSPHMCALFPVRILTERERNEAVTCNVTDASTSSAAAHILFVATRKAAFTAVEGAGSVSSMGRGGACNAAHHLLAWNAP